MKYCALVNPGLENICGKEIKELINLDTKISPGAVEFDSDPKKLSLSCTAPNPSAGYCRSWEPGKKLTR